MLYQHAFFFFDKESNCFLRQKSFSYLEDTILINSNMQITVASFIQDIMIYFMGDWEFYLTFPYLLFGHWL